MTAKLLDGRAVAKEIRSQLEEQVTEFTARTMVRPTLAAVLVGDDPASQVYVRNKERACSKVGVRSILHRMAEDTPESELLDLVAQLNADESVHGILVQLPLPDQIDAKKVLDAIDPRKDVDAFHPENVGRISQGRPRFLPCTPHGIQQLLHRSGIEVAGKHVVIIGRSDIVGKPMAMILLNRNSAMGADAVNATVTVCHSKTADLPALTRQADILIAAIGRAAFVTSDMVKPGATVIDVGINRTEDGLIGDVDFDGVKQVAGAITPVPGGVGPLTIAMLLVNTLEAATQQTAGD